MATDLIQEYLVQLRSTLRDRTAADDICAEVEDHLWEASARLVLQGVPADEAQRRTLACFGEVGLVARSFATAGGAVLPTRTSRLAGTAALIAAAAWGASLLVAIPELVHDSVYDASPWWYFAWSSVVLVATVVTTVAVVGMFDRSGRARTALAFLAYGCSAVAVVALALFTWGWSLAALFLAAAAALGCSALRCAGLGDGVRDVLLIAAWPVALVTLLVADDVLGLGRADAYGDHPLATVLAYTAGAVLFAAGLLRLGRQLGRESVPEPATRPALLT